MRQWTDQGKPFFGVNEAFAVPWLWCYVFWSDVAGCGVIGGKLLWLFLTCDFIYWDVISYQVISWCDILSLSSFYFIMLYVVRCCHVIRSKMILWKWIGYNERGLGCVSCSKISFCYRSALPFRGGDAMCCDMLMQCGSVSGNVR